MDHRNRVCKASLFRCLIAVLSICWAMPYSAQERKEIEIEAITAVVYWATGSDDVDRKGMVDEGYIALEDAFLTIRKVG